IRIMASRLPDSLFKSLVAASSSIAQRDLTDSTRCSICMGDDEAARVHHVSYRCGGPAVFRLRAKLVRPDSWSPQRPTAKSYERNVAGSHVKEANTPEAKNNTIEYCCMIGSREWGGRSCSWSRLKKLEPLRCWVDLPATTLLHRSRLKLSYRTKLYSASG